MPVTRASILAAAARQLDNLPREPLDILELGGVIYVRAMTGRERDAFEDSLRIQKGRRRGETDLTNFRARLAARCVSDERGQRLLTDDDAEVLGELPAGVLDRILVVVNKLSGRTEEEVDELGKSSATEAASDASASSSPSDSIGAASTGA